MSKEELLFLVDQAVECDADSSQPFFYSGLDSLITETKKYICDDSNIRSVFRYLLTIHFFAQKDEIFPTLDEIRQEIENRYDESVMEDY